MNDELMAELTEQFRASTIERLSAMRSLLAQLGAERGDKATLAAIHRHFHGLAGLGGTYGFPLISEIAADAEEACESIGAEDLPDDAFLAMLARTIERIGAEIGESG
ncbi:MAG: Hpt domain-containing protein [Acidobacteria bacterium]|nr:Hpt domain-containing protein [Acidobacteriota bacterium]